MKACLLMLLIAALILSAARAEENILSDREKAIMLADRAMEEKYGITLLTQEYFTRSTQEKQGHVFIVEYQGDTDLAFVLGTYKVTVENGAVTRITWSHDGEDTAKGFETDAWGSEQILEMLRLNQETGEVAPFYQKADEINRKHGLNFSYMYESEAEAEDRREKEKAEIEEVMRLAVLSAKEIDETSMQAIALVYGLTDEQAARLENLTDPEEHTVFSYEMLHGIPCAVTCFGLGDDPTDGELHPNGIRYTEKEGTYWVYVNVLTGIVEEIFFSYGIGGNG